jgi:hemerythrin-like domain-containing protein
LEGDLRRFAAEVAPAVRELVETERTRRATRPAPEEAARTPSSAPSERAAREASRQTQRLVAEGEPVSAVGREGQQTLLAVHQHLRQELWKLQDVMTEVADGRTSAAEARSYLNQMTMRQNYWTIGAFCAAYCRVVSVHHAIEDQSMFPDLKAADQSLAPILERLREEHERISEILQEVDAELVAMIEDDQHLDEARHAVQRLGDTLLAHLQKEEDHLLEPIGRLAIRI